MSRVEVCSICCVLFGIVLMGLSVYNLRTIDTDKLREEIKVVKSIFNE